MIEPAADSIHAKWKMSKAKATAIMCLAGFLLSVFFCFGNGLQLVEIVNGIVADFGLVIIGLAECLILGWMYKIRKFRDHANETSEIKIGRWWDILIKYVIPIVLVVILIMAIVNNVINNPFPGIPSWMIVVAGIVPLILMLVLSRILAKMKGKGDDFE